MKGTVLQADTQSALTFSYKVFPDPTRTRGDLWGEGHVLYHVTPAVGGVQVRAPVKLQFPVPLQLLG